MKARISEIDLLSPAIKRLRFSPVAGAFPAAAAGAHILVKIPGPDRVWKNPYSVVSDRLGGYEIIVRRVEHSRGGSAWLHDHAASGQELEIGLSANLFPVMTLAKKHLLISGGIGITPFLSYMPVLQQAGASFELHHCCRLIEADAFRKLLPVSPNIVLHTSRNTLDLAGMLNAQKLNTHLYVCGPEEFRNVAVVTARGLGWPESKIHTESFGGATGGAPFWVTLVRSGKQVFVKEDESLLDALEAAGLEPPCLCRGGACGVCELPVLEGVPEHRDHVLSNQQRAANSAILTCVSRARTSQLVLDF